LNLLDYPIISYFKSNLGSRDGGYKISVVGNNFLNLEIYCKFDENICPNPCVRINSTFIECDVGPQTSGDSKFFVSYNKLEWRSNEALNFTFQPCKPGFTSNSSFSPCEPCIPGTIKQNHGDNACVFCNPSTYSISTTVCTSCPNGTVSIAGSSKVTDCKCDNGTFYRKNTGQFNCFKCPEGADCNGTGIYQLKALPGYWFDKNHNETFYKCIPSFVCAGGLAESCRPGHTGLLCSSCNSTFYKYKNTCLPCGDDTYITLGIVIGIVIGVVLLVILIVLITKVKIVYLSALFIILGYFQFISLLGDIDLEWSQVPKRTTEIAATSNFNVKFHFINVI
jgi:hypothetical protein